MTGELKKNPDPTSTLNGKSHLQKNLKVEV